MHPADEDAGVLANFLRLPTGPFECLPANFHEQTLLRIDPGGLAWRNAKELGVHLIDLIKEHALARVHLAGKLRILIVKRVEVPTIVRDFAHLVSLIDQTLPKFFRRARPTRKTTSHRNDRDRLVATVCRLSLLRFSEQLFQLADFKQRELVRRKFVGVWFGHCCGV